MGRRSEPQDDDIFSSVFSNLESMIIDIGRRHGNTSGGLRPIPPPESEPVDSATGAGAPQSARLKLLGPTVPVGETSSWVPPGTSVVFNDIVLPDGMIYVGQKLESVSRRSTEPALLNPSLRIGGAGSVYAPLHDLPSYSDWSQPTRRAFLEWLADGRKAPKVAAGFIALFFYGLERRLLVSDPLPAASEKALLVKEMWRLLRCYHSSWLAEKVEGLVVYLACRDDAQPEDTYLDLERIRAYPGDYYEVSPFLELALWHFAHHKQAIPAEYAYQWLIQDPDYSPRTAAERCPEEMEQIFLDRYDEAFPKGVRSTLRKAPIPPLYQPLHYGLRISRELKVGGVVPRLAGRAPLKRLREFASRCADLLGPYSRYVGRHGDEVRRTVAAVSLLPEPLRANHPVVRDFEQNVMSVLNTYATDTLVGMPGVERAALVPAQKLVALYGSEEQSETLTRAPLLGLLGVLDAVGIVAGPDPRLGGGLWGAKETVALVYAASDTATVAGEKNDASPLDKAVLALLIAASGRKTNTGVVPTLVEKTVQFAALRQETTDAMQLAAHALLLTVGNTALPRKTVFVQLKARERDRLANLLTGVIAERLRQTRLDAATLKDVTQLFTLIGCTPEATASYLHAAQTGVVEEWIPVPAGAVQAVAALAPAPAEVEEARGVGGRRLRRRRGIPPTGPAVRVSRAIGVTTPPATLPPVPVVALDMAKVEAKIAESQQISALLETIFTEETPDAPPEKPAPVVVEASQVSPAASGGPLTPPQTEYLMRLIARPEWERAEADALARQVGVLPLAAREAINDAAFELCGEALIEGDDVLEINDYALEQWKETYPLPS